jgi:hypothetical protein
MIILDFLFGICYTPFQNARNGRIAALVWLCPPLAFVAMGLVNVVVYYLLNQGMGTTIGSIVMLMIFFITFYSLYMIYITKDRQVRKGRYPVLSGLVILILIVGSIIFMSVCIGKFR